MNCGIVCDLIEHSGKSYTIDGTKIVGKDNAAAYLADNPDIVTRIKERIMRHYFGKK